MDMICIHMCVRAILRNTYFLRSADEFGSRLQYMEVKYTKLTQHTWL